MKYFNPKWINKSFLVLFLGVLISACENSSDEKISAKKNTHGESIEVEIEKGLHRGRLLRRDDFTLELSIFETGVPPEFRAWARFKDQPLKPSAVDLKIKLTRLGGKVDEINFKPHNDALRGDSIIYEPHSFIVNIIATYRGIKYNWQYDNFEGRTKIENPVADALNIKTEIADSIVLQQTINVFGKVAANTERVSNVNARFAGVIKSVSVSMGDKVKKGQVLARVESNESLKMYSIKAPISGTITQRNANAGEQTRNLNLFTIIDTSNVWVDLSVFPADQQRVKVGASVHFSLINSKQIFNGKIDLINVQAESNQSVIARVIVNNKGKPLLPGHFVKAKIIVAKIPVSLAVKRTGLQTFRDFTVVYEKMAEEYEVRMLELGRQDNEWIEVLGGLQNGSTYVTENSYVIKADIEKSGASHDH